MCWMLAEALPTFCLWLETLQEIEFRSSRFINMVKEILKQPSVQTVAQTLLAACSKINSENQEQKADVKSCSFSREKAQKC